MQALAKDKTNKNKIAGVYIACCRERPDPDLLREKGLKVIVIGQSPRFDHSVQYISTKHRIQGRDVFESPISLDLDTITQS